MNRLAAASSPYLLQHRDNPVDWFEWGREAFAEAKRRDVPILLSIGYAACHWCHVMAHESFENPAIAELMNGSFVNIKLDREERPDVDQLYMGALQAIGVPGGWPLTMFLTPDRVPFWGGTYFPPEPRYGQPGFPQVLSEIARLWREERPRLLGSGQQLLARLGHADTDQAELSLALLDRAAERLLSIMDAVEGGTQGAPKFPNASVLEVLERAGDRSGDARFHAQVDLALTRMSLGGIYDHVGGGFCRYAVDAKWLVPHFEKMLYDNAQLIALLTRAWLRTRRELFRLRIEETVAWLEREMLQPCGAFASSLDADSDGHEGAFYVWTPEQVTAVLGDEAAEFCALYDIRPEGNWEGVSIPNLSQAAVPELALGSEATTWREALRVSRETRPRPGLDDKILADWNALAIAALAGAATVFARPDWLELARRAYRFVAESMFRDGRLGHSWREGRLIFPGFATDYAALAGAALALAEATGDAGYINDAASCLASLDRYHRHPLTGLFTLAAADAEDLPLAVPNTLDEAVPNAHGLAAAALVRLALLTGRPNVLARADELLTNLGAAVHLNVFAHASVLNALDLRLDSIQIVLSGPREDPRFAAMRDAAQHIAPHRRVLIEAPEAGVAEPSHPAFGKGAIGGRPTAYVCIGERCSLPILEPDQILEALRGLRSA